MLDYRVLNSKPTINLKKNMISKSSDKEKSLDLLADSLVPGFSGTPQDLLIVNEYYVARPDLLSLAVYGSDEYADVICKYNEISNPFDLNEDMLLFIPEFSDAMYMYSNPGVVESPQIENDKTLLTEVKNKFKFQKKKSEVRSPSQQTIGDKNYIINREAGIIIY